MNIQKTTKLNTAMSVCFASSETNNNGRWYSVCVAVIVDYRTVEQLKPRKTSAKCFCKRNHSLILSAISSSITNSIATK